MGSGFWPPVPYTPPQLKGTRKPVVFWYTQDATALREFDEAVDLIVRRVRKHQAVTQLARLDQLRADYLKGREVDDLPEGERDEYARTVERIAQATALVDADDCEPLADDTEERARALGIVLESVEVGGEVRLYPEDHAERVAMVRQMLPAAVAGLIAGIRQQRTNDPGN